MKKYLGLFILCAWASSMVAGNGHSNLSKLRLVNKIFCGIRVCVVAGDISSQPVHVIVNAANEHLTGGAGVDGAIHDAAGSELADYCIKNFEVLGMTAANVPIRCPVGQARVTPSFGLAKYGIRNIIHVNGPRGSMPNREQLLESCYQNALKEANRLQSLSIAFPAISVGIFCYPIEEASACAVRTVADMIQSAQLNSIREIRFVLFDQDPSYPLLLNAYKEALAKYMPN